MKMSSLFKRKFILALTLLSMLATRAAEPTLSASSVSFAYVDAGQFNISFTAGNGAGRIVVVKEGSDIINKPVDGTSYGSGSIAYGTAASQIAAGEYVVYAGNQSSMTITGLKKATTYYVAIFEYNGTLATPSSLDYSPLTPTGLHTTTLATPTQQAQISSFSLVTGNTLRVNYTRGNGTGRIVAIRKGSGLTALPVDYTFYNSGTTYKSSVSSSYYLDADTYIVQKANATGAGVSDYADINGLEPNTTYTAAVFEYNSNQNASAPTFLTPTTVQSVTTNAGPTKAASGISFTNVDGNRLTMSCTYGNGTRRLIIAKKGSAVTATPVNNTSYTANAQFGAGTQIATDEYVVYNGTSNGVTVTGLEKSVTYYFAVYEYDVDLAGNIYYQQMAPGSGSSMTAVAPTANTTITVSNVTGSSAQLTYNVPASGAGYYRMLVIKEGSATDFVPQDLTQYGAGSSTFGSGTQVKPGTYVLINQGNGGAGSVTGLTPGHSYYVTVFDMNGYYGPVYLVPGSTSVINVPAEPTSGSTNFVYSYIEGSSLTLNWTSGNGARRILVARKNSAVTSLPQDGTTYTASTTFGSGSELTSGQGEYVVYDGTSNYVTISNLEKATTYQFAVFEYNSSATGPDYLTTSGKWLSGSKSTAAAPTTQATNIFAYNVLSTQASISYTSGNGSNRIFLVHEGAPVDATPQDLVAYNYNGSFGSGQQLGTGNYAVAVTNQAFLLSNLKANTTYYVTSFEFNGSSTPVYNTTGNTVYSFTTAPAPATVPTQAAQSPVFSLIDGNKFRFAWTSGNGSNRIVVARAGSAVTFTPTDGNAYTANAAFASGTDLGSGQYVVYNGSNNNVDVTNLSPSTTYYFAVYEYNGTSSAIKYLATALTGNASTSTAPTQVSASPSVTMTTTTATLSFAAGNGAARIVVLKEGGAISGQPANLTTYSANNTFQNGTQIAAGEYVVYNGTGSSVTINGLTQSKTYSYAVFEYNGSTAPVYNQASALKGNFTLSAALPVKWLFIRAQRHSGEIELSWGAEEINVAGYTIERSTDGAHFTAIAQLNATALSGENDYSYHDRSATSSKYYYRIKQTDKDGRYTYSAIIVTETGTATGVRILQNPAHSSISFQCDPAEAKSYRIVDAAGRVLVHKGITSTITTNTFPGTSGMYYLIVLDKNGKQQSIPFLFEN